jgi:hypothetical protein
MEVIIMKFIKLTKKQLEKILEDFAHDLTYHSVVIENGKLVLPKRSKDLIDIYIDTILNVSNTKSGKNGRIRI